MTFAISILLKGTFMACVVLFCLLGLKKTSAARRHWVLSLGLLALLLLPVFQIITPSIEVEMPLIEELVELQHTSVLAPTNPINNPPLPAAIPTDCNNILASETETSNVTTTSIITTSIPLSLLWSDLLLGVWILGFSFFFLKLCLGIIHIWRITKQAKPCSLTTTYQDTLPLRRKLHFLESSAIKTPMTWGFFRPAVLLPTDYHTWSEEELRVIVLHELAHIKRNDYALHLLGMLTLCLYWWHPLVWVLQIWQQEEREKACDEYVLGLGVSKTHYAAQLVQIARAIIRPKSKTWQVELPMAQSSSTKKRVLAILQFDASRWQFSTWVQWRWLGMFTCSLPLLAAVHPSTRNLIEERIPAIETALEQPVFEANFDEKFPLKIQSIQFLPKKEIQLSLPDNRLSWTAILGKKVSNFTKIESLASLEKKPLRVRSTSSKLDLNLRKRTETLPRYGTWTNPEGEQIQVWTKGEFELSERLPYFTNLSEDALIIIEIETAEQKRALVVNQAAYDSKTYSEPTEKNRNIIYENQMVFHWLVDDVFYSSMDYDKEVGFKRYGSNSKDYDLKMNFTNPDNISVILPLSAIDRVDWGGDEIPDFSAALEIAKADGFKGDSIAAKDFVELLKRVPIKAWDEYPNWASRLDAKIAPIVEKMLTISEPNIWQTVNPDRLLSPWRTMMSNFITILANRLEPVGKDARTVQEKILREQTKADYRSTKQYRKKHHAIPDLPLPSVYAYIPNGFLHLTRTRKRLMPHFYMMETEITNSYYREFLSDMQRNGKPANWENIRIHNENWNLTKPEKGNEIWAKNYHTHAAFDKFPVVNVSYEGATAYCNWLTKKLTDLLQVKEGRLEVRLPTREEWMYAASGGHVGNPYPWGAYYLKNTKGCYLCNFKPIMEEQLRYNKSTDSYEVVDVSASAGDCFKNWQARDLSGTELDKYLVNKAASPVRTDTYFPNDYGLYNMSGNAAEMLLEKGSTKGGSWNSTAYYVRINGEDAYAGWNKPSPYIGFRPVVVIE